MADPLCPGVPGLRLLVMGRGTQLGGSPCSDVQHLVFVSDQLWEPGSGFEKPLATPGDGQSSGLCHRLPAGVRVQQPFRSGWQCESPLWISFCAVSFVLRGTGGHQCLLCIKSLGNGTACGTGNQPLSALIIFVGTGGSAVVEHCPENFTHQNISNS